MTSKDVVVVRIMPAADLKIRDYRFVEPDWCPEAAEPPLRWARLESDPFITNGSIQFPRHDWKEDVDGPTTKLHSLEYRYYEQMIEICSMKAQLAVFRHRYSKPDEDPINDAEYQRLVRFANKALEDTRTERRTQLVCVEVR